MEIDAYDPFAASASDVFGSNVNEVDVWDGHDSFGGDKEWADCDGSDGSADFDRRVSAVSDDEERTPEGERRSDSRRTASRRRHRDRTAGRSRTAERSSTGAGSTKTSSSDSRRRSKSGGRRTSSRQRSDPPGVSSSSRCRGRSNRRHGDEDDRSLPRTRRSESLSRPHSKNTSERKRMAGRRTKTVAGKDRHCEERPYRDREENARAVLRHDPNSLDTFVSDNGTFDDAFIVNDEHDPFDIGTASSVTEETNSVSTPTSEDHCSYANTSQRSHSRKDTITSFDSFSSPTQSETHSAKYSREGLSSRIRRPSPSGASRLRTPHLVSPLSAGRTRSRSLRGHNLPTSPLVKRRDGSLGKLSSRQAEENSRQSQSRRAAVRDSLFKSIGDTYHGDENIDTDGSYYHDDQYHNDNNEEEDPDDDNNPCYRDSRRADRSLGSFMKKTGSRSSSRINNANRSVTSAPPKLGSASRRRPPSGRATVRRGRRTSADSRGSHTKAAETPTRTRHKISAKDLAEQLGEDGYIEVVDGKMRLVFDVDV